MNIMYIAYSCDPYNGSEDKIGWNVPVESAKTNNVYVITKEEQRRSIEKYLSEHMLENIEFYFIDIPKFYKKIFKGFMYSGRLNVWHRRVFSLAKKICKEKNIDIIHQVTPIEFRAIGDYGKIPNVKFVCGPLGGGEFIPQGLEDYAKGHKIVEIIRKIINYWFRYNQKITGKIKQCDFIMFANKETCTFMLGDENKVLTEIAIDKTEIEREIKKTNKGKKCIFLVAGRVIYRKGHDFLLDALTRMPEDLEYECRIVGDGSERGRLQKRCSSDEKLSAHIVFVGKRTHAEMEKEYQNADVLIMPSIRETTGTVLLEAMSKGLPVIAINKFGGAILLDDKTGWLYEGNSKELYVENLKQVIIDCILNPDKVRIRGNNARKMAERYTWENKNCFYQKIYCELLEN